MTVLRWKPRLLLSKTNKSYNWTCCFGLFCVFCLEKKLKLLFTALMRVVVAGKQCPNKEVSDGRPLVLRVTKFLLIHMIVVLNVFIFSQRRGVKFLHGWLISLHGCKRSQSPLNVSPAPEHLFDQKDRIKLIFKINGSETWSWRPMKESWVNASILGVVSHLY